MSKPNLLEGELVDDFADDDSVSAVEFDDAESEDTGRAGVYFTPAPAVDVFSSGSVLLDCVLGGGYPVGRIVNVVGDRSTGKTLLAIEACANFLSAYSDAKVFYCEVEAAFDKLYAQRLGLDTDRIVFPEDLFTVEDVFAHLSKVLKDASSDEHILYIIDSLDALSDKAELDRGIDEGTFGATKAKQLSQLFRRVVQHLENKNVTVFIISQVRDNIGVSFGRKVTRSGGRALDFYASQILFLSQVKTLTKTRQGVERAIGVNIKAKCDKNKVGMPFRDCEFPILFNYGIDDVSANLTWLEKVGKLDAVGLTAKEAAKANRSLSSMTKEEYIAFAKTVNEATIKVWYEIEEAFLPKRSKY